MTEFNYEHDLRGAFLTKEEIQEAAGESGILTYGEIWELFQKKYGIDMTEKDIRDSGYEVYENPYEYAKTVCKSCRHELSGYVNTWSNCPYCGEKNFR